jgi:hypothetical protein
MWDIRKLCNVVADPAGGNRELYRNPEHGLTLATLSVVV